MARLTTKGRNALPTSKFAEPAKRGFPINDPSHARNALARAGAKPPAEKAKIKAAVKRAYPGIKQKGE